MGFKVKLIKSIAGAPWDHVLTARGMGLWKFGQERLLKDTPAIRGMAFKIQHLVSFEVVKAEPKSRIRHKRPVQEVSALTKPVEMEAPSPAKRDEGVRGRGPANP